MNKDLQALIAKVNKEAGEGSIMLASELIIPKRYPTGAIALDVALGGGLPGGHWIEVVGRESHGKTAIVLKTIAENQRLDPEFTTLWLAGEHYDIDQAAALGVDNDRVIVIPTQEIEFAYEKMIEFAESGSVDCIVLDSYPALAPMEEIEKGMDEATMAIGARLTGKFFRKIGPAMRKSVVNGRPILGLFINQFRDAIGQFSPRGVPQTTPGGKAKNYAFYVRLEVKRDDWIKEKWDGKGEVKVGQTIKVTTTKNKSAAPQQIASLDFYFREAPISGFHRGEYDIAKQMVTMAVLFDVVQKRGAWIYFGEQQWQGAPAFLKALRADLDLQEAITSAVMEAIKGVPESRAITEADIDAAENIGKRKVRRREEVAA